MVQGNGHFEQINMLNKCQICRYKRIENLFKMMEKANSEFDGCRQIGRDYDLLDTIMAVLTSIPDRTRSMLWCKCATPKNSGVKKMAVVGLNDCNSNGIMQARNVNSSESGATIWLRSHKIFCTLSIQYVGVAYVVNVPFNASEHIDPKKRMAVSRNGTIIANAIPAIRKPIISHMEAFVVWS